MAGSSVVCMVCPMQCSIHTMFPSLDLVYVVAVTSYAGCFQGRNCDVIWWRAGGCGGGGAEGVGCRGGGVLRGLGVEVVRGWVLKHNQ